jgi:hypothetical protein
MEGSVEASGCSPEGDCQSPYRCRGRLRVARTVCVPGAYGRSRTRERLSTCEIR